MLLPIHKTIHRSKVIHPDYTIAGLKMIFLLYGVLRLWSTRKLKYGKHHTKTTWKQHVRLSPGCLLFEVCTPNGTIAAIRMLPCFCRGTGSKGISIWMVPIPAVLHIGAFSMRICKQTGK